MNAMEIVARLMVISATTAPKSKGENFVKIKVIAGQEMQKLGSAMISYGKKTKKKDFDRDGENILNSEAVVIIGLKDAAPVGLNCGACGYPECHALTNSLAPEAEFKGPICALRILDMGIALGSAVKTASMLNVDNRIMYRVGAVARQVDIIDWDYAMGIPLSAGAKNIYFDR